MCALLEERVPLSQSMLWGLQKDFYDQRGIDAWASKTVPSYITSNPFVARGYATMVVGFLQDLFMQQFAPPAEKEETDKQKGNEVEETKGADGSDAATTELPRLDVSEPVYLIEYGAGSGRLAYYFLKAYVEMRERMPWLRSIQFRYVMSDFTQRNIDFWMKHRKFQPFIEEGLLDFARIDAQLPYNDIELIRSGVTLTKDTCPNPIIAVGNYFFCVVEMDAYMVDEEGRLFESMVTTRSTREHEPDLHDFTLIERVRKEFTYVPVDNPETRYPSPDKEAVNRVLTGYHTLLAKEQVATSFLLPVGSARCFEGLVRIARGHECVLILVGDKGYNFVEELIGRVGYPMSVEGSFSFMSNMDGLGRYCTARGGDALFTPLTVDQQGDTCLSLAAYLTSGSFDRCGNTTMAFRHHVANFGPGDYYQIIHAMATYEPGNAPPPPAAPEDSSTENRYVSANDAGGDGSGGDADAGAEAATDGGADVAGSSSSAASSERNSTSSSSATSQPNTPSDGASVTSRTTSTVDELSARTTAVTAAAEEAVNNPSPQAVAEQQQQQDVPMRDAAECGYSLQMAVAPWKLSYFDPYVFWMIKSRILYLALQQRINDDEKRMLAKYITQTYDNHFHIGETEDLPFELGRLAYQLQIDDYQLALDMYLESEREFGEHYITHYNIGLCHSERGELDEALARVNQCIAANAHYVAAYKIKSEVLERILARQTVPQPPPRAQDADSDRNADSTSPPNAPTDQSPTNHPGSPDSNDIAQMLDQLIQTTVDADDDTSAAASTGDAPSAGGEDAASASSSSSSSSSSAPSSSS